MRNFQWWTLISLAHPKKQANLESKNLRTNNSPVRVHANTLPTWSEERTSNGFRPARNGQMLTGDDQKKTRSKLSSWTAGTLIERGLWFGLSFDIQLFPSGYTHRIKGDPPKFPWLYAAIVSRKELTRKCFNKSPKSRQKRWWLSLHSQIFKTVHSRSNYIYRKSNVDQNGTTRPTPTR